LECGREIEELTRGFFLKKQIGLRVNGFDHQVMVEPHWTLLDVLRDELGLTGTKKGCDKGECGTCTVIMDGEAVLACLVLAVQAKGKDIATIEGLVQDGKLDPVREAFVKHGAIQCGFCTPGMIMTSKALLKKEPQLSKEQIKKGLSGNLCRCTGYTKIIEAVAKASANKVA
jgi:carbon-monoxide dehydrogenase small subunit